MRKKSVSIQLQNISFDRLFVNGSASALFDKGQVHVPFALPGDIADVNVTSRIGNEYFGKISFFHEQSSLRQEASCKHFGICGGCQWQHINYDEQLKVKQSWVQNLFSDVIAKDSSFLQAIVPAPDPYFYRNKMEYTFSNRPWTEAVLEDKSQYKVEKNVVGFHVPGRFDKIMNVEKCFLQADPSNSIRDFIQKISFEKGYDHFDSRILKGFLRNLIIRCTHDGQFMVILSVGRDEPLWIEKILSGLKSNFPDLASIYYVINLKPNPTLSDQEHILFHGTPEITENINGLSFIIGPKSFFQSNTKQTESLYDLVLKMANPKKTDVIYDLYTGAGTIACVLASHCKEVIGIESVEEAVQNARMNAKKNDIMNAEFYSGDTKDLFTEKLFEKHGSPDIVVLDPPRPGLHEDVLASLLSESPEKIVYVSCNPETQLRDVNILRETYKVSLIAPVDMVPQTRHVENVILLEKR